MEEQFAKTSLREGFPYRVQFSEKGLKMLRSWVKDEGKRQRTGTAIRKDKSGSILVIWDGRKSPDFYHPSFITKTNDEWVMMNPR